MTSERMAAVAAMVDSWYWQVQEQGKWRYKYHTEVMVRYYEAAPLEADVFPEVIEFLQGQTNLTTLQLHGKTVTLSGVWDTNRVWYETRDGDTSETNKLKRVRIYQALVKDCGDQAADGPYTVENGCRWNVTHKFYWQVPELPSLPTSSSGVNYQMQGVTRDQDTGLFNCVIEKRTRVQQDVAEYVSEKTVFEKRSEATHLGVKQSAVSGTGKAASAGGGQLVTRKVSKNDDCTSDVQNVTVDEVPVAGAVVEKRRTLRGTETTTTNRNQTAKASDSGLAIGQSVRNELTPGGRWTQTIRKFTAAALGWLRMTCRATIFEERDSQTSVVAQDPGFTHRSVSLGEGKTKEISVTRTEDGAFEMEESTTTEKGVTGAVVTVEKDLEGITETTVNRNASAPEPASGLKVGESVRNEVTEGGRYNTTVRHVSVESVGQRSQVVQQGPLETVTRTVVNQVAPGEGGVVVEDGKIVLSGNTLTQRGSYDYETSVRVAVPATAAFSGGTMMRRVKGDIRRNTTEEVQAENPAQNESIEVSESINEFGLKDTVKRTTRYGEQSAIVEYGSSLVDVQAESHENSPKAPTVGAGNRGTVTEASCSMNDRGSYDWRKTVRTARVAQVDVPKTWTTQDDDFTYTHTLQVYRNAFDPMVPPGGEYRNASVSFSINEFGLYDGHYVTTTRAGNKGGGSGDSQWDDKCDLTGYMYFQKGDGELYRMPYTCSLSMKKSTMKEMIQHCKGGENCRPLGWVSGIQNGVAYRYSNIATTGTKEKIGPATRN